MMRQLFILTIIALLTINCYDNKSSTENRSIAEKIVTGDIKIPINKSEYSNFLVFKGSDTSYVFSKIRSGNKQFGNPKIKAYSVGFFKRGDWTVLQLDTAFSLLFYHSLITWIDGPGSDIKTPKPILGISLHETDNTKNYSFVNGNYYQRKDTEVGLFENGTSFSIYVPKASEEKGNLYTSGSLILKEKNLNDFFNTYDFPFNTHSVARLDYEPVKIKVK
jgi:hypothetical protein